MTARSSPSELVIPQEIAAFLDEGPIMHVASRGPDNVPEAMHAAGARVVAAENRLEIYLAEALAGGTLSNVRANGEVALTATRVTDNRSVQLKGTVTSQRTGGEEDRSFLDIIQDRCNHELALIGIPRSVSARLVDWPCVVLSVRVREIFEQTPGPRAGQPLESQGGPL